MSDVRDFRLSYCADTPRGLSPYRLMVDDAAMVSEVDEVNEFLDAQATRGLSPRSLRAYGYSLLNFWRWQEVAHLTFAELSERDVFVDYIRFQLQSDVEPAATTINHRLTAVCGLYRYHFNRELSTQVATPSHPYHSSVLSSRGYLYPARRRRRTGGRLKSPRRVVMPLSSSEVRTFLESFSTWRDLALAGLMLLCGLRSRELIELRLGDLDLDQAKVRVRGKGQKERLLPLPDEVIHFLGSYLKIERPARAEETLFVSLKGKQRGEPMTPAGLRSLFRYHRRSSNVERANPHRFRHTFGSELAAAGISLPALKELMGHSDINTTMRYVHISRHDVWREFQRVLKLRNSARDQSDGRGV